MGIVNIINTKCCVRLCEFSSQGLHSIFLYIGAKRKVSVTKADLIKLLTSDDASLPPETSSLGPSTQQQLTGICKWVTTLDVMVA